MVMLALIGESDRAYGQDGTPTIEVARTIPADPATLIPFPIRVGPSRAIPRNSFVRVRGLPSMAALSEGYSIGPGSWAVPLQALADLKITLPIAAEGRADVSVSLVAVDGSVLAEVRTTLVVSAPPRSSARSPPEVPAPALPAERSEPTTQTPSPPTIGLPVDRERALQLLKKGEEQLAQGLVAPARLLFERAADLGLAQAAMALGATYDAAELDKPNLRGISPDAKQAKRWYERARQLGASEADIRLRRLDGI
jgi:TPR repeat protein